MQSKEKPVTLGAGIKGTSLIRRFSGDKELPPLFVPRAGQSAGEAIALALQQCSKHGIDRFVFDDQIYEIGDAN